jgi:hypothetical protein
MFAAHIARNDGNVSGASNDPPEFCPAAGGVVGSLMHQGGCPISLFPTLSPKKTENQDGKNHQADARIELVSLSREAGGGEGDANEGINQQQDNTDHNEAAAVPDSVQIQSSLKHPNWIFEIFGLSAEDMVAGWHPFVGSDEPNQTGPHDGRGDQNSRQHHPRQRLLELDVVH